MAYSAELMGKSTREVMAIWGITEPTLRTWILTGKTKPIIHKIGTRNYYDFPDEEVERVKKLINKKWKQGKPKIGG